MKTNLFIVGAPKCGTTAWANYLDEHPQISFCPAKEPHYFSDDFENFRWARTSQEYHALFSGCEPDATYIAEASPMYLYSERAAENIHRYNPDAKILILLREHGSFLVSYHRQLLNNQDEELVDIATAWARQARRSTGENLPKHCREPRFLQYRDVASFSPQVRRYLEIFGDNQVKIMIYEKWTAAPNQHYREVMRFLELPEGDNPSFEVVNSATRSRSEIVSRLTQRPPSWAQKLSGGLRKILGRERLGIAGSIRKLNSRRVSPQKCKGEVAFLKLVRQEFHVDTSELESLTNLQLNEWNELHE